MKQTYVNVEDEIQRKIKKLADLEGMKIYRLLRKVVEYYIKHENISLDK